MAVFSSSRGIKNGIESQYFFSSYLSYKFQQNFLSREVPPQIEWLYLGNAAFVKLASFTYD